MEPREFNTPGFSPGYVDTRVPARLDRLPWTRWHWIIITALGVLPIPRTYLSLRLIISYGR
jgi:hypothetical protein